MNIIYNQDNGIIAVVTLADNTNIETKAKHFVPKGKRYKIVTDGFLPADQTYHGAWRINDSELTDGVGVQND